MHSRLLSTILLSLLCSCSFFQSKVDFQTYTHPSIGFSIEYPKNWELQEGGELGGQVSFLTKKTTSVFRANANIVVSKADIKNTEVLARLSTQQLKLILNDYELITQNSTQLGHLDGFELRGKYKAKEGMRTIRTIVAIKDDNEFVFTFTCPSDKENNYTQIVNHMIQSFKS